MVLALSHERGQLWGATLSPVVVACVVLRIEEPWLLPSNMLEFPQSCLPGRKG